MFERTIFGNALVPSLRMISARGGVGDVDDVRHGKDPGWL